MHLSRFPVLLVGATLALHVFDSAQPARAQSYSYRSIADTSGAFTNFGGAPVINNNGDVAFVASLDNGVRGVFSGNNPLFDTIADDQGAYDGFNYPSINEDGDVAFRAFIEPSDEHFLGGSGIFIGDDPEEDFVALHLVPNDPPDPWGSFDSPSINNEGTVAFGAITATGRFGIYTGNDPETDTYADDLGASPFSVLYGASINDEGTVAFFAELKAGGGGIFTGDNLMQDTVARSSGPYAQFGVPAINDEGTVAFMATLDAGGEGIFTGSSPTADAVVTTAGLYSNIIPDISINNDDTVVFAADLDAGGFGIFTGPDPALHKVIAEGDALFDSTVEFVSLFSQNLNDNGEVAFLYELVNGRVGVAVASPGSLDRMLDQGDEYDGIRLTSAEGHDTEAELRHGVAGDDRELALSFEPGGDFNINGNEPVGDVLDLSGTGDDLFALELTYSDDDLLAAGVTNESNLLIQWRDPNDGNWKNSVLGNTPPGGQAFLGLSFDEYIAGSGIATLGAHGNDPDTNTVWAVLNHNSLFAIAATGTQPLAGDYNQNGTVDAADYTMWRDGGSPDDSIAGYNLWRASFGRTSGFGESSTVPEPASTLLTMLAIATIAAVRWRVR